MVFTLEAWSLMEPCFVLSWLWSLHFGYRINCLLLPEQAKAGFICISTREQQAQWASGSALQGSETAQARSISGQLGTISVHLQPQVAMVLRIFNSTHMRRNE